MPIRGLLRSAFAAVTVFLCLAFLTEVSLANDTPVVPQSQVDSESQPRVGSDGRRWRLPDPERPPGSVVAEPPENYTGWLIASYLSIPALSIGLPVLIGETWEYDTESTIASFAGLAVGCSLPATVHWLYGDSKRGVRNIVAVPLIVIGGFAMGALMGAWLTSDAERESNDFAGLDNAIAGALIGGVLALATWATYDVLNTASAREERRRSAFGDTRFAIAPVAGGVVGALAGRF